MKYNQFLLLILAFKKFNATVGMISSFDSHLSKIGKTINIEEYIEHMWAFVFLILCVNPILMEPYL